MSLVFFPPASNEPSLVNAVLRNTGGVLKYCYLELTCLHGLGFPTNIWTHVLTDVSGPTSGNGRKLERWSFPGKL